MSLTPIVDLEQEPPRPKPGRAWIAYVIAPLIGVVMGLTSLSVPPSLPGFNWFILLLSFYLAVAVHEAGHLMGAKLTGMEVGGVAVLGFLLLKSGDGWTFRFDWRFLGRGFAKPLPARNEDRLAPFVWMVAAGPIASILLTILCAAARMEFGVGAWEWTGPLFWAAASTVLSLIPMSWGASKSDGALLWLLLMRPQRARSWIALLKLQAEESKGALPGNWDSQLVEAAMRTETSQGEYAYVQLLAHCRSLEQNDLAAAAQHIEVALAYSWRVGRPLRQSLFLEAASFCASVIHRPAQARVWLDRALKLGKSELAGEANAAIAICEGRYEDALQHLNELREFIQRRGLDSGLVRLAKQRIAEQEKECRLALMPHLEQRACGN